jgi:hypothetical protein
MEMERKSWVFGLWIGLVGLVLVGSQFLGSPEGIFIRLPLEMTLALGVLSLALGAYAYHKNRLTPWRVIATALTLIFIFATPNIVRTWMN